MSDAIVTPGETIDDPWIPPYDRVTPSYLTNQAHAFEALLRWQKDWKSRLLLLEGPPGVGKTTILRRLRSDLQLALTLVRRGKVIRPVRSRLGVVYVLDASEWTLSAEELANTVAQLISSDRESRVIVESRPGASALWKIPFDAAIKVEPVSLDELVDLLGLRLGRSLSGEELSLLMARYGTTPYALFGALAAMRRDGRTAEQVVEGLRPFRVPTLFGADGQPVRSDAPLDGSRIQSITAIDEALFRELAQNPERMYQLSPRTFEELVAEIFSRKGYEVTLTRASRDGGKDLYVARTDELGTTVCLVECKRYRPDRPVGVRVVRELLGVVDQERATSGIVATTSRFTSDAIEFQRNVRHRMAVRDYLDIRDWIRSVTPGSRVATT